MTWKATTDLAVELYEDYNEGKLILQPDYQREFVWTALAQSQFIETILCGFPVAQIYFHVKRDEDTGKTIKYVVDGQQRLTSIILFLQNELILKGINDSRFKGKKFQDIQEEYPDIIKTFYEEYILPGIKITNASDEEIRDIYIRINKYTVNLNAQELRTAMYKGDFLSISQDLTNDLEFWEKTTFFSQSNARRMNDIEYVSELLSVIISKEIQDKKIKLNNFYDDYVSIEPKERTEYIDNFKKTIELFISIFPEYKDEKDNHFIDLYRYKQKADFYSLFSGLYLNFVLTDNTEKIEINKSNIQTFLIYLNNLIRPSSSIQILSEYANKCVSSSNDKSNRVWRMNFLLSVINYCIEKNIDDNIKILFLELEEFDTTIFTNNEISFSILKGKLNG